MIIYSPGQRVQVRVPDWLPRNFERLGDRMREAREEKGLTQGALCDVVGMTRPQLSRYENGRTIPSLLVLSAIAMALDERLDWLVLGR